MEQYHISIVDRDAHNSVLIMIEGISLSTEHIGSREITFILASGEKIKLSTLKEEQVIVNAGKQNVP